MRVPIIVVLFLLLYLPTVFAQSAAGSQSSLSTKDASGWKLHFTKAEAGIAAPQQ